MEHKKGAFTQLLDFYSRFQKKKNLNIFNKKRNKYKKVTLLSYEKRTFGIFKIRFLFLDGKMEIVKKSLFNSHQNHIYMCLLMLFQKIIKQINHNVTLSIIKRENTNIKHKNRVMVF